MSDKVLFSYTGIFDKVDDIIHAAEKVADAGYTKYDVNTPYPVHGMDGAMKLKPSKLGYAALVFGLSGLLAALLTMYWMVVADYPIVIGGKPFFAFPAFVPIIFEVTVLAASIGTVMTMLFLFFKFPNNKHPLHDTDYMKHVSSDKYGISIQADDPAFNENEVKSFLESIGAQEITPIYFEENEYGYSAKIFEPKFIGFLIITAFLVSGATYFSLNKLMFMTPFNWMMEQGKAVPQEYNEIFANARSMQQPVKGTISRGNLPYEFKGKPEEAERVLLNPLQLNEKNLTMGKANFNIYCSPCHGYFGEGDSRMRGQFPNPPSLHSEKARNWSDGRIYHIISDGQNIMPSYSSQLTRQERWATVLYIRALQRSLNAKESDLK
ncbi:MAG: DUF3341 domain-containing protein [Melioribacteraceae bacterium]|nr:DUF3341 domain-containing protein [Melioribacteraceae bacterium]MCF8354407.1 DUF3341 domain-containing protein [Melioribacteraceae bacterium]MCF8392996.1 DUF3341 domain-containing protein [Melioribacteraceae bacterium]MCF8417261.1 DUF3341 domain-containing protein [Melioribacteraceae bacterium]